MKHFGTLNSAGALLQVIAFLTPFVGIGLALLAMPYGVFVAVGIGVLSLVIALCLFGFGGLICLMVAQYNATEYQTELLKHQTLTNAQQWQQPLRY